MSRKQKALLHVSGFCGAGKSTLAAKIKRRFPQLKIKDLDDFLGTACNHSVSRKLYPFIPAKHLVWLDVDLKTSTMRAMKRQLKWLRKHEKDFLQMSQTMNKQDFSEYLNSYYNYHQRIEDWKDFRKSCPTYVSMKECKIFDLLQKELGGGG
jgi:uridine kinase